MEPDVVAIVLVLAPRINDHAERHRAPPPRERAAGPARCSRAFARAAAQEASAPSFCLDFWTYRHLVKPSAAGGGKGARASRVTLYKALRGKVVRMWVGKDAEGVGKLARATLEDALVTDTFDKALALARKHGAAGELTPLWNNYATDVVSVQ